jgi:hypothetical protein
MRRNILPTLNDNDRIILNYYIDRYNDQKKDIDLMYRELKNTSEIIDKILGVSNNIQQPEPVQQPEQSEPLLRNYYYRMDILQPPNLQNLEDVQVGVSRDVILRNTKTTLFSEVVNPLNLSCPIQLERFMESDVLTQIIGCGHLFFPSGLERWFQSHAHCPMCRYDIRTNEPTPTTTPTTTPTYSTSSNIIYSDIDPSLNILTQQFISNLFSRTNY